MANASCRAVSCGTGKVPFVTGDVQEHGDVAVGLGAWRGEEPHACRCHPGICGTEVLDMEEKAHPAGGLPPDDGGLILPVGPREQQARHGAWRPHHHLPLGTPVVRQGRRILHEFEPEHIHEEADGRVVFADHDGDEAQMHGASIEPRPCSTPNISARMSPNAATRSQRRSGCVLDYSPGWQTSQSSAV
jgi:hypothetical protein